MVQDATAAVLGNKANYDKAIKEPRGLQWGSCHMKKLMGGVKGERGGARKGKGKGHQSGHERS